MKKDKLDTMRSRLSVEKLQQKDRGELFDKFRGIGGKIINLDEDVNKFKEKTSLKSSNNTAGATPGNHNIRPDENENPFHRSASPNNTKTVDLPTPQKDQKESFLKFFFVRFSCFLANIFNFSASRFSGKFIDITLKKAYVANATLKSFLAPIFALSTSDILKFRDFMAQLDMLPEYEYAFHAYHLLDDEWMAQLNVVMPDSVDKSESFFRMIFRKLVFFTPHQKRMQVAVNNVIQKYEEFFRQKIHPNYTPKKIDQVFSSLWIEWYVWVEELITYYWVRFNYKTPYLTLDQFLNAGVNAPLIIGKLADKWAEQYKSNQEEKQKKEAEPRIYPTPQIEKGATFILNHIDFLQYLEKFRESKDLRALFSPQDKIFYTYAIMDFFDKEFSLVWNEIGFYIIPSDTGRFDPKKEIRALENKLNQFDELVNDYLRIVRASSKNDSQNSLVKDKEIARSSFNARQALQGILEAYTALLSKIFSCKGKGTDSIGNWGEAILTHKNQEQKILYGHTVEQILIIAYDFMSTMVWLLKFTDLSGLDGRIVKMIVLPDLSDFKNGLEQQDTH
ncbi:MAG: hypothetical protein ACRCWI_00840 [Brevinema sp.]